MNVLFVQDSSPCIRNIKYAEALQQMGVKVHLLHRNKTPDQGYGRGDEFYASLHRFNSRFRLLSRIRQLIITQKIDLIHYHNQPDILGAKIIKARLGVPVVFDCHDFMSFKHGLGYRERVAEKTCNELACGVVYPSARYLQEAMQYYSFTPRRLVFGNYFPRTQILQPSDMLPKLSSTDNKIHLVYEGRLAQKKNDHRYIVRQLEQFPADKYVVHIFPSNRKEFVEYRALPQVCMEQKRPYSELIRAMSAMDYGLVLFHDTIAAKLTAIRYAFANKTYDYLCAGLPVLAQDCLDEVRDFVVDNSIGMKLSELETLPRSGQSEYRKMVEQVLQIRGQYSMEAQIQRLLDFYDLCRKECHA